MTIGLDTGFFVQLARGEPAVAEVWEQITSGQVAAAFSCLTIYELQRLGLRGVLARETADTFVEELPVLCRVVWLDQAGLLRRAAHVAQGNNLSMADALILVSLQQAGVGIIYTTDSDLKAYQAGLEIRVI